MPQEYTGWELGRYEGLAPTGFLLLLLAVKVCADLSYNRFSPIQPIAQGVILC